MEINTIGRIAGISDPHGAVLFLLEYRDRGAHEPDYEFETSFGSHGAPSWFEMQSPDPDASTSFYTALLGWNIQLMEMPTGPYRITQIGDSGFGGISPLHAPGIPAHWAMYVTVDDTDALAERAVEAGGRIVVPAMDIPKIGRMVGIRDPFGATVLAITYLRVENA
jgi:predicted enzyme related to lactoylglutathione lyase